MQRRGCRNQARQGAQLPGPSGARDSTPHPYLSRKGRPTARPCHLALVQLPGDLGHVLARRGGGRDVVHSGHMNHRGAGGQGTFVLGAASPTVLTPGHLHAAPGREGPGAPQPTCPPSLPPSRAVLSSHYRPRGCRKQSVSGGGRGAVNTPLHAPAPSAPLGTRRTQELEGAAALSLCSQQRRARRCSPPAGTRPATQTFAAL